MDLSAGISLVTAIICSAAMAIALRFFQTDETNRYGMILGNYLTCTLTGFFFLKDPGILMHAHSVTVICGLIGGVLFVASLVCMQSSIRTNGAILTAAFSRLGLLVPLALSLIFFHEQPGILQIIGLIIVFLAIWVLNSIRPAESASQKADPLFLIIVLLASGASDAMAKIFETAGSRAEDAVYIFIVFLSAAFLTCFLLYAETKRSGKKAALRDFAAGTAVGIPNYFSSALLLKALSGIPAFIAYPVFSTGAILLVTFVSVLFLKERIGRRQILALAMILTALILLNL